jgi:methoxymalonate biosynthesis protein
MNFSFVVIGSGVMGSGIKRLSEQNNIPMQFVPPRDFLKNPSAYASIILDADAILECVSENLEIKKAILLALSELNTNGLVCSNTSSIPLNVLQDLYIYPDLLIGMHFMNPPHKINLIEIALTQKTKFDRVDSLIEWCRIHELNPIVVPPAAGYVLNNVLFPMLNQAARVKESTSCLAEEIDLILSKVCGHPMGPLKTLDLIGIDVSFDILKALNLYSPDSHLPPADIFLKMIELGHLGKKSGRGFYAYD